MKIFHSSKEAMQSLKKGCVLTMGNYDGFHRGHQSIVSLLKSQSFKRKLPSLVYTFDPHPVKILAPEIAPSLINTLEQKIELLQKMKIDILVLEKFTPHFAKTSPEGFFQTNLMRHLKPHFITVGYDFTFGSKRMGNIETLERLCFANQVDVKIVDPKMVGQKLASSSLIRKLVEQGKVEGARELLNRPYFMDGEIIRGEQRGTMLGFPTANLKTENEIPPDIGVYATLFCLNHKNYSSVTNVGHRPTFGKGELTIETHVLGLKKNIYGKKVRVFFIKKIRDEKKFDSEQFLIRQIRSDINQAKQILSHYRKKHAR